MKDQRAAGLQRRAARATIRFMSHRPLILASTSRYRQALLARLSVPFSAVAPACDESLFRHLEPATQARTLALRKAQALPPQAEDALIIGSDQVLELSGEVLHKPGTAAAARAQLRALSGRQHRLLTAVAVYEPQSGRSEVDMDVHTLTMRDLSDAAIAAYVAVDQPLDCAGAYALERRGIALFAHIAADPEGADDTAIIGLPLMKLCRLLRGFGYDVLEVGGAEPAG